MMFHLRDILTVYTGRFLSRSMDDVYRILNYLTGGDLMTHQLPFALEVCRFQLEEQLPFLKSVRIPPKIDGETLEAWVKKQTNELGARFEVKPLKNWVGKHPLRELLDTSVSESRVFVVFRGEG